jgi:hypothetical protein
MLQSRHAACWVQSFQSRRVLALRQASVIVGAARRRPTAIHGAAVYLKTLREAFVGANLVWFSPFEGAYIQASDIGKTPLSPPSPERALFRRLPKRSGGIYRKRQSIAVGANRLENMQDVFGAIRRPNRRQAAGVVSSFRRLFGLG